MYTSILALTALAAGALAQTPPDTKPSTTVGLTAYYGSLTVAANDALLPTSAVASAPRIVSTTNYTGTYMLFLLDLSIKTSQVISNASNTTAISSLTPGLGPDSTTRLHWWSGNLTQTANGTFVKTPSNPADLAPYAGPKPPVGSAPHTYTLYLFPQPDNFTVPGIAATGTYQSTGTAARMNFSLADTVAKAGGPVAARYFRAVAENGTASASGSGAGTASRTGGGAASTGAPIGTAGASRFGVEGVWAGLGALLFAVVV